MTGAMWKDVGAVDDVPAQGARVVASSFGNVAVFRTSEGGIYAMEDRCPHLAGPLSQGIVHGGRVTCPLHNLVIELATGGVVGPDGGCVVTLPVRVQDGRIHLDFSVLSKKRAA